MHACVHVHVCVCVCVRVRVCVRVHVRGSSVAGNNVQSTDVHRMFKF